MTRKEALAEARTLAPVMAALNSSATTETDSLVGIFAVRAGARMVMPDPRFLDLDPEARKRAQATLAHQLRRTAAWQEVIEVTNMLRQHARLVKAWQEAPEDKRRLMAPPAPLAHLIPNDENARFTPRQLRSARRSAARFREWIGTCAAGKADRLLRRLARRRLSATDRIAYSYLQKIARLGIYRCHYAECGRLTLNTSGHADRKYCTGTNCARNDSQARIMAGRFARLQAEKIHRAKAAIAKWPGSGDLKDWIAVRANVSKRWVTEAARRGDIHVPGEEAKRR